MLHIYMAQFLGGCLTLDLDIILIKSNIMKSNFILTFLVLFFTVDSISQTKSEVIFVDGVCGMCEKRIESNCLATKGIKLADWNKENRMLKVIFNEKKISLEQIHKKIASIGHDTKFETAPDEAYNNLYMCCKYRDEEVVKNHQ